LIVVQDFQLHAHTHFLLLKILAVFVSRLAFFIDAERRRGSSNPVSKQASERASKQAND